VCRVQFQVGLCLKGICLSRLLCVLPARPPRLSSPSRPPRPGDLPLPFPGPRPPSSPFARATWGATLLHLGGQALAFGAVAVLADAGIPQLLRRLLSRAGRGSGVACGPVGGGGGGGGGEGAALPWGERWWGDEDADVAEERAAVAAGEGCGADECSVRGLGRLENSGVWARGGLEGA
jgi:hypothetical protein